MKVTVNGNEHVLDGQLTGHEWRTIKQVAGVRVAEYPAALAALDYDLVVALAIIAMRRNGEDAYEDELLALPTGAITVEFDGEDEVDPTEPADAEAESSGPPSKETGDDTGTASSADSTTSTRGA